MKLPYLEIGKHENGSKEYILHLNKIDLATLQLAVRSLYNIAKDPSGNVEELKDSQARINNKLYLQKLILTIYN